jgi:hypothetical protein
MKKLLPLLFVGALISMWNGCTDDPVGATNITITIESIGGVVIGSGTGKVTGDIDSDADITNVKMDVLDASNNDVSTHFERNFNTSYIGEKKVDLDTDLGTTIGAKTSATAGTYKLKITVTAGDYETSATKEFAVTGGGTPVTEKTNISLGAQNATPPSLLDADDMTTFSNTITSETDRAKIDVIFVYSTVMSPPSLAFTSPSVAAGSPYDTWVNKPATEFKVVTATWASITTQEHIDALWGTGAGSTRMAVAQGNIIVIKTSELVYKVIEMSTVNGADGSATINIKGKY